MASLEVITPRVTVKTNLGGLTQRPLARSGKLPDFVTG
jgi:hypothetical protein